MVEPAEGRRWLFISWARLRRADTIAGRLGMPSLAIRYFRRGTPPLLTVWKYCLQAVHTFWVLIRRRPRVVFLTSPPIFAAVPVWFYAALFRARYVIDFHSGCFLEEHWRRWDRWQRFFARRAALNLVHNADNARAAAPWGARCVVFPSLPPDLETAAGGASGPAPAASPRERPLAVYICSWKSDEPFAAVIAAARTLPEVDFQLTGRAPAGLGETLPPNARLSGFLGEEEYNRLLAGADVIIALTTRPGTLLYGAQEAIALHKPLVLSRTPTLEAYFPEGTVFAENAPEALRAAVADALARRAELASRMAAFDRRYRAEGEARLEEVRRMLAMLST